MEVARGQAAVAALADALSAAGLKVALRDQADPPVDLVATDPAGRSFPIEIKRLSLVNLDNWQRTVGAGTSRRSSLLVVIGDRITADARDRLNAEGVGWLDLRGHLHLSAPGLFIDSDVPTAPSDNPRMGIATQVGREVAALLLLDPRQEIGVRRLASEIDRAPSSVSEVLQGMREGGLIEGHRVLHSKSLFWELAKHWRTEPAWLQRPPDHTDRAMSDALRFEVNDLDQPGWALTDSVAAAALGAPVGIRSEHPPDFYVPDLTVLRRAERLLGRARPNESRGASVRVAPVPMVCARRVRLPSSPIAWPMAHPIFVALELAQDPGRGQEVLKGWTPPEPWSRVW